MERIKTGQPLENWPSSPAELALQEPELLISPQLLQSGISALITRYRDLDKSFVTPEVCVEVGEGENHQVFTVAAGNRDGRNIIFKKDEASGRLLEWIIASDFPVTIIDGSGHSLEAVDDCRYVRSVIDAMKQSYERGVTEKADTLDIKEFLVSKLEEEISVRETELESLRSQRSEAESLPTDFKKFKITIRNAWEEEGGQSLEEEIEAPSLSEAMKTAVHLFKDLNDRKSTSASSFSVGVSTGKGQYWIIPDEIIKPLSRSLLRDEEEDALACELKSRQELSSEPARRRSVS